MINNKDLVPITTVNEKKEGAKSSQKKVDVLAEKKKRALKETANFKKKYFDYYDDIKISAREDW